MLSFVGFTNVFVAFRVVSPALTPVCLMDRYSSSLLRELLG